MLNYISIKPNKIMYIEFAWKTLQLDKWSTIEGLDMHASLSASCIVNSKMNFIFINTIKSMGDSVTASNSYNSQIVTQVGSQIRVKKRVPCYLHPCWHLLFFLSFCSIHSNWSEMIPHCGLIDISVDYSFIYWSSGFGILINICLDCLPFLNAYSLLLKFEYYLTFIFLINMCYS